MVRFPSQRVLLPRTKLAYVHLRNLITDAKRDRSARVYGYVAMWLPEELLILYMQEGEVAAATTRSAKSVSAIAVADAIARVPGEPELGEICFHEADDEQLACMYAAETMIAEAWPAGFEPTDPRKLFPYLASAMFDGMVEIVVEGATNYLILRDGAVVRSFLTEAGPSPAPERVKRLFVRDGRPQAARVRRWPVPPALPVQAPPALIAAYRELVHVMVGALVVSGKMNAPAIAEQARQTLLPQHPVLASFAMSGQTHSDPVTDARALTTAIGTWLGELLWTALGPDGGASDVLRDLTRSRRQMFQSAGLYDALPFKIEW